MTLASWAFDDLSGWADSAHRNTEIAGMSGHVMFGKHKLLRDGIAAQAVVVSSKLHGGDHDRLGTWHLELAVPFPDGSTGSASCTVSDGDIFAPSPGDVVPVRYNANDHSKVVIDLPELDARKAARKQAVAQADAIRVQRTIDLVREHPRDTPTS